MIPELITKYIPEEVVILKDYIYAATSALKLGLENSRDLLSKHDESLGRTTKKNKVYAELLEKEVALIEVSIENLSKFEMLYKRIGNEGKD